MGINFDPGYAQYTTILSISVESIYASISRFKNLNQKKMQFRMYYPKIKKMVDNNVAFCFGCILSLFPTLLSPPSQLKGYCVKA